MPMKQHYLWSEPELVNHLRSFYATDMFSHFKQSQYVFCVLQLYTNLRTIWP